MYKRETLFNLISGYSATPDGTERELKRPAFIIAVYGEIIYVSIIIRPGSGESKPPPVFPFIQRLVPPTLEFCILGVGKVLEARADYPPVKPMVPSESAGSTPDRISDLLFFPRVEVTVRAEIT